VKRRQFMTLIGGAAATWPLAAGAQQIKNIPKVGVLWHAGSAEEEDVYLPVVVKAFNDLGYIDGKNIRLVHASLPKIQIGSRSWRENWST
jgi:putative ABC transport system substrate-binding protein